MVPSARIQRAAAARGLRRSGTCWRSAGPKWCGGERSAGSVDRSEGDRAAIHRCKSVAHIRWGNWWRRSDRSAKLTAFRMAMVPVVDPRHLFLRGMTVEQHRVEELLATIGRAEEHEREEGAQTGPTGNHGDNLVRCDRRVNREEETNSPLPLSTTDASNGTGNHRPPTALVSSNSTPYRRRYIT